MGNDRYVCIIIRDCATLMIPNIHCHKKRKVYHPNETVFSSKSHWNEDDDDVVLFSSFKARSITEKRYNTPPVTCMLSKQQKDDAGYSIRY